MQRQSVEYDRMSVDSLFDDQAQAQTTRMTASETQIGAGHASSARGQANRITINIEDRNATRPSSVRVIQTNSDCFIEV